jgi:hypothetical protein
MLLLLLFGCAVLYRSHLFLLPLLVVGECAKAMWMSDPADSETEAKVAEEEQPRIITCASCKGDFSTYKGEVSCCNCYASYLVCLRLFTGLCSPITDSSAWREYLPFSLSPSRKS